MVNETAGDVLRLSWTTDRITMSEAERDIKRLAVRVPYERVAVELCASQIDIPTGSLLTNALRRYAAKGLLETPTYSCAIAGVHCQCSSILPALETYLHHTRPHRFAAPGLLRIPQLQRPTTTSVDEFIAFHHRFNEWLNDLLKSAKEEGAVNAVGPLASSVRQSITQISYHAVQNVYDHAYQKPFGDYEQAFSHLTVHVRDTLPTDRVDSHFPQYAETITSNPGVAFLDITISDDGIGIPARHAQDEDIYWGDECAEQDALARALEPHDSVKMLTFDAAIRNAPGFGLHHIVRHAANIDAYVTLRTGRFMATLNGTLEDAFVIHPEIRGYVPGTMLNVLVPLSTAPATE